VQTTDGFTGRSYVDNELLGDDDGEDNEDVGDKFGGDDLVADLGVEDEDDEMGANY
jgi:hypothetical protein